MPKKERCGKSALAIEEKVDLLLARLEKAPKKPTKKEFDPAKWSPNKKVGEAIYYLRERTKKSVEELSGEIVTAARKNLGKKPLPRKEAEEQSKEFKEKKKKKLKFGKKKEKKAIDEPVEKPKEKSDVEPGEDKESVHEVDQFLGSTKLIPHNDEVIDNIVEEQKNIVGDQEVVLVTKEDVLQHDIEEEIIIPPEEKKKGKGKEGGTKRSFLKKRKNTQAQDTKNIEVPEVTSEDFDTLADKYAEHLIVSLPDSVDRDKKEVGKEFLSGESKEVAGTINKKGDKKPVKKKSFFKKDKTSKRKEDAQEDNVETDSLINKLGFRVENLPASSNISKDEVKLVEDKIKETREVIKQSAVEKKLEQQAKNFAKEHLKENMPTKEATTEKEDAIDLFNVEEISKEGDEHEHVFFDESEMLNTGWSPQVTEEEKRNLSLPLEAEPEIKKDDIELPKDVLKTKSIKLTDLGFSENEWEELEFYPLIEPFAYVEILREKESLDKRYFLVEVGLTPEEQKALEFIIETVGRATIDAVDLEVDGDDKYLMKRVRQVMKDYDIELDSASKSKVLYYLEKNSLGLGQIDPLMRDPNIEDISCDGANVPLFLYHRQYGSLKSNIEFKDEEKLASFIHRLAQKCGKHISIAEPMLDATMPDGSRIQMTLSDEITAKGSTFTIRKFREDPFSPPDLVEFNTMSSEMIAYMWLAVENGINTLVAGGTASGKTTVLNALSLFIPRESKIVSIEETREINLPHPNWIPGVARSGFGEIVADKMVGEIDMYDLMKAALRQRPEYILVGEIRGREAYVLFQAMATGHTTYSTVHADSAKSLIHRMEGKPIEIPRVMLQALDVVSIHVTTRVKGKRVRRCKQIIEIIDIDPTTKEILTNEVFRWDPVEDKFIYSGKSYVLERIRADKDLNREEMTEEIKNRTEIVEWMNDENVREFREVAKLVTQYNEEPTEILKQIRKGAKS